MSYVKKNYMNIYAIFVIIFNIEKEKFSTKLLSHESIKSAW